MTKTKKTPWPGAGEPFTHPEVGTLVGYVAGYCGHRVAASEWRAGFRTCERCPASDYAEPGSTP